MLLYLTIAVVLLVVWRLLRLARRVLIEAVILALDLVIWAMKALGPAGAAPRLQRRE